MRANPTKTFATMLKLKRFTSYCIYANCGYTHIYNANKFIRNCVKAGFVRVAGKEGQAYIYEIIL